MRGFFSALRFLTILPGPARGEWRPRSALLWFPLVGLLLGALAAGPVFLLVRSGNSGLAALAGVVSLLVLSGGLHLDGLADCADGFFSHRSRDRTLLIMKDSRIGAMGVIALVVVILAKVRGIEAAAGMEWRAVLLMPVAGRAMILLMMAALPYARPEGGIGAMFYGLSIWPRAIFALAFLYLVAWFAAGYAGLAAAGAAVAVTLLFSLYSWLVIGGATGDTLGAVSELAEVAVSLAIPLFIL